MTLGKPLPFPKPQYPICKVGMMTVPTTYGGGQGGFSQILQVER